jgi:hypothetical protein
VKRISLEFIKETLTELDPTFEHTEEDDYYRTALVLLSALAYGPETRILARFTDFPRESEKVALQGRGFACAPRPQ